VIIFSLIWFLLKIIINQIFFKKKPKPNLNRFKPTGFGSVRFFKQKPVQTGLARFFSLALFFGLARFFSGLARFEFGSVFSVSGL
jgi:hypothetical protein